MKKLLAKNRTALITIVLGIVVYLVTLKPVFLNQNGTLYRVFTHGMSVGVVLRDAGVNSAAESRSIPPLSSAASWGLTVEILSSHTIEISYRGEIKQISAPQEALVTADELLTLAGITLSGKEWILADGVPVTDGKKQIPLPVSLEIRQKIPVAILTSAGTQKLDASGVTVGDALWQAGIRWRVADSIGPPPTTPLAESGSGPVEITVGSARTLYIAADGQEWSALSSGSTVGEVLAGAGIPLIGLDYSVPGELDALPTDGRIRVVRVRDVFQREQETIPFDTKTQPNPALELDQQEWTQAGIPGVLEKSVRVRLEDGVETARTSEGERVLVPPQSRILGYGTKIVIRTENTPDGPIEYWRKITVYATSYSPCHLGVTPPRCGYVTYSGKHVEPGMIAMVVQWFNMFRGQSVYVQGYGHATVEDVGYPGPAFAPFWIDEFFLDEDLKIIHQYTTLYFLTPVPANPQYLLR
jgi:resuscitation-promoting factor RpfB